MTRDELETSIINFLDGSEVVDVEATLEDYMDNVIDAAMPDISDEERDRIENDAKEILKSFTS